MKETCKHCGLGITDSAGRWVHSEGLQQRLRTCAIEPYGYEAAPVGEPCNFTCIGARPTAATNTGWVVSPPG